MYDIFSKYYLYKGSEVDNREANYLIDFVYQTLKFTPIDIEGKPNNNKNSIKLWRRNLISNLKSGFARTMGKSTQARIHQFTKGLTTKLRSKLPWRKGLIHNEQYIRLKAQEILYLIDKAKEAGLEVYISSPSLLN